MNEARKKVILYYIARKLHRTRKIISLIHIVMGLISVSHASYSQNTSRRKRSRPSDGIASSLEMIAESVKSLITETKDEVRILADSMRPPKLTAEMQQCLRVELRRLGLAVGVRVKAMNIFLASPDKFEVLQGYEEDEEKLEYVYACLGQ